MSAPVADRLRELLGPDAVEWSPDHVPRALPDSTEATARVCREAHARGWQIRVEGHGTWLPTDAPADLTLSTAGLTEVTALQPSDLVATAQSGIPMDQLEHQLRHAGAWLAIDAPGRPERSLGGVVASGTTGALRHAYGPVRDQIIGCTVVTGDGRVITPGGRVTKNVAGYDLTKLQVGGFGGFGILTELHLRLRALPPEDRTLVTAGDRDPLTLLARNLEDAGMDAVSCELLSPAVAATPAWVLAVRLQGPGDAVHAEAERLRDLSSSVDWELLDPARSPAIWHTAARAMGGGETSIRLGVLPESLDEVIDLLDHHLDTGLVMAGAARGGLRWSGAGSTENLRTLRHALAAREIPLTLERGPWTVRQAVGHFGAYREGVGPLVNALRQQFDPGALLQVALSGNLSG